MSDGGKGSKPRPIEDRQQFADNWDRIFSKKDDQKKKTEAALDELVRINEELGLYDMDPTDNPLIKK